MNKAALIIAVLVVAGTVIFVSTKSSTENSASYSTPFQPKTLRFANSDEVALAANIIIGDLYAEATEALPSGLRPNTQALLLTDEEKAELFSILNSGIMGALGAPGSMRALGASPMLTTVKVTEVRQADKSKVDKLRRSVAVSKKKLAKSNRFQKPTVKAKLAQVESDLNKAIDKYKHNEKKRIAEKKTIAAVNAAKQPQKLAGEEMARVQKELVKLTAARQAAKSEVDKLRRSVAVWKITLAKSNRFQKPTVGAKLAQVESELNKATDKYKDIEADITKNQAAKEAEKKRIAAENAAKQAQKLATEEKARAEKELAESKARAAAQKATVEREKAERNRAIVEAKKRTQARHSLALAQRRREQRAADAAAARRRLADAQAKTKARAVAKKAAQLQHRRQMLEEKVARDKAAAVDQEKKNKLEAELKLEAVRGAEKVAKGKEERARLSKKKAWLVAEETARKSRSMEEERRREQARQADLEKMRYAAEVAKSLEKKAMEERARERAEADARMEAEGKERTREQKQAEEQAAVAEKRQLELEKEDAHQMAMAKVVLKHTAASVVAKTASVSKKGLVEMKAMHRVQQVIAESNAEKHADKLKRIDAGVQRITGITGKNGFEGMAELTKLSKEVLFTLVKFLKDEGVPENPFLSNILKEKIAQQNSTDPVDQAWVKIEEITGLQRMRQPGAFVETIFRNDHLALNVLEQLHEHLETVPEMQSMADDLDFFISFKTLQKVAAELNIDMDMKTRPPFANVNYDAMGKETLDRLIQVFDARPHMKDGRGLANVWKKLVDTRQRIEAQLIAQAEALEEERLRKQSDELAALEKIRAAEAERKLEEVAEKLAQEKLRLEQEAAQLAQHAAAETERLLAKQQAEIVAIESQLEEEKKAVVEQITVEVQEAEQELSDVLQQKLVDAEVDAEKKVENAKQEHVELRAQQHTEADNALQSITAEISEAHAEGNNNEIISVLGDNLREEAEARQVEMQEADHAFAAERAAVVEEAEEVKQELVQQFQVELEEEKTMAEKKLAESVEHVESQKEDLIEMQQEVHELEKQEMEIEVNIQIDTLEEASRAVEHQQEIVANTDADDVSGPENQHHPRASKKGRVAVSKTKHADGSSVTSMSVPSDLAPGEADDISIVVSKEDGETLAIYHAVYNKIARDNSLADLSFEEKKALAAAGVVFKQIREQYVQQRKDKVLMRTVPARS